MSKYSIVDSNRHKRHKMWNPVPTTVIQPDCVVGFVVNGF